MHKKLTVFLLILIFILFSGFGCKCQSTEIQKAMQPITLTYWRVFDESSDFGDLIARYNSLHPFIKIEYRKLRYDEYEKALLEAFATDRGPDIFSIHNTWTRKYQSKGLISAMPPSTTLAYPVVKGKIKKEVVPELRTTKSLTLKELKNNFVDTVYDDVVIKTPDEKTNTVTENVYGLPLFIDTLALFYNKDLFNNAGITNPPQFWNKEFQQDVKKMTKQDNKGQLVQSGVALGGSDNIERSGDILSVLMMLNGTEMMSAGGSVTFNQVPENFQNRNFGSPGLDALRFYTDFSNPAKEVYSWNKSLNNSLDLFIQGKLAMMFGYSYMLPVIKSRAPKLNFSVSALPQIEGNPQNINYANYWVESVSKKSKYQDAAWDFVQFITKAEQAKTYLDKVNKPTALRALVDEQKDNADIGVFAEQVLTAESWYKGQDAIAMEKMINEMIDSVVSGQAKIEDAINLAASKVQQTIYIKEQ